MGALSISKAWDETKAVVGRDGRLFATISLALVGLPQLLSTVIAPDAQTSSDFKLIDLFVLLLGLVTLVGQLAIARLALAPPVTVGEAINRAIKRFPVQLGVIALCVVGAVLLFVPFFVVAASEGASLTDRASFETLSGRAVLVAFAAVLLIIYFGLRLVPLNAVVVAEKLGPVAALVRSWKLTSGNVLRLFVFFIVAVIVMFVLLLAVGATVGALAAATLGAPEPLSAAALVIGLVQAVITAAVTVLFVVMSVRIYTQLAGRDSVEPLG